MRQQVSKWQRKAAKLLTTKIEITTDDILAGDIVALEVNADGEVTSLTILAYGTGSYVDTTEAETDLAEEALLGDEASTEAVTE